MMRKLLGYTLAVSMAMLAFGADTTVHKTAKKAPAKKAGVKGKSGKKTPVRTTTWRNRQLAPTPERYKEIQDALVAKGYLRPEDSGGGWNQTSADALKRFQGEQNIEASGKINSLSLIALGLGPKHDTPAPKPVDAGSR